MRMGVCVARWAPVVVALAGLGFGTGALGADPWADGVVSFEAGVDGQPGYDQPLTALGSPERFTGEGVYPGAVTPFNPVFGVDEAVSIGEGGQITVRFDEPVRDDALNPFGIDLLVFGNQGYTDTDWPHGIAGGLLGGDEGGIVEVSADGVAWFEVAGAVADGLFPTLGYLDLADPYALEPGLVPSDFTRPVDPAFDAMGLSFAEIVAGYAGSGGGAGIDLADVGLSEISFVRVSNPMGSGVSPEIDGFSDVSAVPGPGMGLMFCVGAGALRRRRP